MVVVAGNGTRVGISCKGRHYLAPVLGDLPCIHSSSEVMTVHAPRAAQQKTL